MTQLVNFAMNILRKITESERRFSEVKINYLEESVETLLFNSQREFFPNF